MPKRKSLNGIPHNLTKSYFSTLRYWGNGYMADWLVNAARQVQANEVRLDIVNTKIDPAPLEIPPLLVHLKELKQMLQDELVRKGFAKDHIVSATIRVALPGQQGNRRILYCFPEMVDVLGNRYRSGRIIEDAYIEFNPL